MENNVTIKVTRNGYEIKAMINNKEYTQKWIKTLTGSKTTVNDFKNIQDEDILESLDSLSGGDLYEMMKAL